MSELLDKQVNAQKESLKNISRVHTSSRKPTNKCVMKQEKMMHMLLIEGGHLLGACTKMVLLIAKNL